jgi:hypothetical protein
MEDASLPRASRRNVPRGQDEVRKQARLRSLELSRARALHELSRCENERFRALLEAELAFLEAEIRKYSQQ